MGKYLLVSIALLLFGFVWWCLADFHYDNQVREKQVKADQVTQSVKCETRYKRLLKTKQIRVPILIGNNSACQAELEACTQALSNIKLWCDPNCRQQLGECLEALQAAHALKYECQSWKF